ncbi:unnamed protein product (macronuclear) [Paramecium tetraurelia]|uniref:Uncharacterized protein n=1 Tax=Paramecium tetraurelia TaxID=5888 RepID=A0DM26_PARTE|nr:uncharacterized protein GSPATT00018311001 [Paramecium tetraurelia]CAK84093.1 unnamed protein product [Paramecium tetraurelia]|eukprot:XP_001451490.1 hypothetical protein (macronuclear) [Paramecium tetraurelia strain d4-2]
MAEECCFDCQPTINSDEDEKMIDVLTFPTNFFGFSEASTQSPSNSEQANCPITSPRYKFMGRYYSAESQEQNDQIRTFKDQKPLQTDQKTTSQVNKCSNLDNLSNKKKYQKQQYFFQKKKNSDRFNQRICQEKPENKGKDRQRLSLSTRSNNLNESKLISNRLNSVIKVSCLKGTMSEDIKIRQQNNFDIFSGRASNKNVCFQFTMEQIKSMRKNNKLNIFSTSNGKLFLI